eukprot:gnl/Hemi2/26475_TR8888_c0_g1_i1.p2 gnl/Hemi2/26475_TR8888_c0_g1~~gnl/Hemi2/26475_TR8888_c0_g1_i1.p2  ORF type:complete len:104 (-),score=26.15 gnl/Hemi2/26475_TR8888_c0_g1_i1:25-336(-)
MSSEALISSLGGSSPLIPAFSCHLHAYTLVVGAGAASVDFLPTASQPGATLKYSLNGGEAVSHPAGSPVCVALCPGQNSLVWTVVSEDCLASTNYTLSVAREG